MNNTEILINESAELKKEPELKVKFSVKLKFSLLIGSLCALITLFVTLYLLNKQKNDLLNEMRYRARIITKNLSKSLGEIINDDTTRHQIIKETATIKDIKSIEVIDLKNNLMDHTDDKIWQRILFSKFDETVEKVSSSVKKETLEKGYSEKDFIENGEKLFYILEPIKISETILGYVKVNFTKKEILARIREVERNIIIFMVIAIGIAVIVSYVLSLVVIKPIKALSKGAVIIGSGNLDYQIKINSKDELGYLAEEFNNMTRRLKKAQESLIEKERYEEQLEIAKRIQVNLLPDKIPQISELDMASFYKAAKGVGGDYYDIFHLKDKQLIYSIIADVSGKGVPAALIMVMIRTIFYSTVKFTQSPDQILKAINSGVIGRLTEDKFATIFVFGYNYKTGVLKFSNAAHNPLLLFKSDKKSIIELDAEGVPVGIDEDVSYEVKEIKLEQGDIIVLYTDGVTEAMNESEKLYTLERLKARIIENSNLNPAELKNLIISDINSFVGNAPQHDDMTLVIFKINEVPQIKSEKEIKSVFINPIDPYSIII